MPIVEETVVPIRFSGLFTDRLRLPIYPGLEYDIILGKDWIDKHNPLIDWRQRRLVIKQRGKEIVLRICADTNNSPRIRSNCVIVPRSQILKSVKDGDEVFVGNVRVPSEEANRR